MHLLHTVLFRRIKNPAEQLAHTCATGGCIINACTYYIRFYSAGLKILRNSGTVTAHILHNWVWRISCATGTVTAHILRNWRTVNAHILRYWLRNSVAHILHNRSSGRIKNPAEQLAHILRYW
jgi:hypothetical protein